MHSRGILGLLTMWGSRTSGASSGYSGRCKRRAISSRPKGTLGRDPGRWSTLVKATRVRVVKVTIPMIKATMVKVTTLRLWITRLGVVKVTREGVVKVTTQPDQ